MHTQKKMLKLNSMTELAKIRGGGPWAGESAVTLEQALAFEINFMPGERAFEINFMPGERAFEINFRPWAG